MDMSKLKFAKGNAKLDKKIYTFSLPAGRTCPGAKLCHSMAVKTPSGLKIKDGPHTEFRCFAASQEVFYKQTYMARAHNLKAIMRCIKRGGLINLIEGSLPKNAKYIRVHVSGDFFSQEYFDAWVSVAQNNPTRIFYAYTKSLPFWSSRLKNMPQNFPLTASFGGKYDGHIAKYNLRYARVVFSEEEAARLNLPIDHDDSHAINPCGNFALLLHGIQPRGSKSAKALRVLKKAGLVAIKRPRIL